MEQPSQDQTKQVRYIAFYDVESLCQCIPRTLDPMYVLNAYIIGSASIPESSTRNSDLDCIVVVHDDTPGRKWKTVDWLCQHGWIPPLPAIDGTEIDDDSVSNEKLQRQELKQHYKGTSLDYCSQKGTNVLEYDVWIYKESSFRFLLEQYVPIAVECLFAPPHAIWRETISFSEWNDKLGAINESDGDQDRQKLVLSFAAVSQLHLWRAGMQFEFLEAEEKALASTAKPKKQTRGPRRRRGPLGIQFEAPKKGSAKNKNKNESNEALLAQAQKTLFFALRYLEYARQILAAGRINDRSALDATKQQLASLAESNDTTTSTRGWNAHMQVFEPLHEHVLEGLYSQLPSWPSSGDKDPLLGLLQGHVRFSTEEMGRYNCRCRFCLSILAR